MLSSSIPIGCEIERSDWLVLYLRQYCRTCPFEWDDHSPVTYQNWNEGEPNNWGDGEDCVEMFAVEHALGLWNDHFCTDQNT